ncbi:MAG TPA: hypothetical protein VFN90_07265 [Gemmatimonadales bacterium]|nr:hypothetical protein [Gemmatimonadales bacterium]
MSRRGLLVELVGPIVDDRDAVRRTLADALGIAGVTVRPGALDAVVGGTAGWALETTLGGHGRDVDAADIATLRTTWSRALRRELAVEAEAIDLLRRCEAAGQAVGVVASVPHDAVPDDVRPWLVPASDDDRAGAPRPDALVHWLAARALPPAEVLGVARSPAVMLAMAGARVGRVMRHGSASGAEALPWDGSVASLAALRP